MLEDSFVPRPLKTFHSGPVDAAVVAEDISCFFQNHQIFWSLAGRPVQESAFPCRLQVGVLGDPDGK
jgi:hypothetical protein